MKADYLNTWDGSRFIWIPETKYLRYSDSLLISSFSECLWWKQIIWIPEMEADIWIPKMEADYLNTNYLNTWDRSRLYEYLRWKHIIWIPEIEADHLNTRDGSRLSEYLRWKQIIWIPEMEADNVQNLLDFLLIFLVLQIGRINGLNIYYVKYFFRIRIPIYGYLTYRSGSGPHPNMFAAFYIFINLI